MRSRKLIPFKLLDVAERLNYLHNCHMLRGDLKGVSAYQFRSDRDKNKPLTFSKQNLMGVSTYQISDSLRFPMEISHLKRKSEHEKPFTEI